MTEPARKSTGPGFRRAFRSAWSVLIRWRDWTLRVKLAAITALPMVFAVVLGAVVIGDQVSAASSYQRVDRLVATGDQVRKLATWLQRERTESAALLANGSQNRQSQLLGEYTTTDAAARSLFAAVDKATFGTDATAARYTDVRTALAGLPALRTSVVRGSIEPARAVARYSDVIKALLGLDAALSEEVVDPRLAGTAGALHDLEAAKEEVYFQQALLDTGIIRGLLPQAETASLAASQARLADQISDFRSKADAGQQHDYDRIVAGPVVKQRQQLVDRVSTGAANPATISITDWDNASELVVGRTSAMSARLGRNLQAASSALQDKAGDGAGTATVLLLLALVLALGAMIMVARHLLRSLSVLRRSALQVARHDLPAAVAAIRNSGGDDAEPEARPVAVHTRDEVGQVARAFDAVHSQALRLAAEQAGLRANYGSVFVNLSRRSQGLVQRQLQLLERLERDEEDADQLATLFQLDHLATRMRRNNENLMVLSGSDLTRRSSRPVPLAELLRAAVAEIEQYQRVLIQAPADAVVVGYAASDLVRLIAELLDNATAFSAPETQVTIASRQTEDGAVGVDVLDHGIGMSDEEVTDANRRLARPGSMDVSASRRMGLFVVGRLAGRHGVQVRLNGGTNIAGVRAAIVVPRELVLGPGARGGDTAQRTEPEPSQQHPLPRPTNGVTPGGGTPTVNGSSPALPKRANSNGTNGSELPLPRRRTGSDGAQQPAALAPGDQQASADPEATDLFSATEATWWDTGVLPPSPPRSGKPDPAETTPIFDAMVSAWFRAETPAEQPGPEPGDDAEQAWNFAADDGWQTAEAVSTAEPSEFTDNGLPRRTPREKLVPGSVDGGDNGTGVKDVNGAPGVGGVKGGNGSWPAGALGAHELRTRLSKLQEGLARGRGGSWSSGDRQTPTAQTSAEETAVQRRGGPWQFDSDDGFAAAEAAAEAAARPAGEQTEAGLPQRSPRERLVPGSVITATGSEHQNGHPGGADPAATQWSQQDADALRGRLGSFQRGVSRGRRQLADQPSGSGAFDNHDERESE